MTNEEGLCLNVTEDQVVNNSVIVDYHLHKNITLYCIQKGQTGQICVNKFIVIVHGKYFGVRKSFSFIPTNAARVIDILKLAILPYFFSVLWISSSCFINV